MFPLSPNEKEKQGFHLTIHLTIMRKWGTMWYLSAIHMMFTFAYSVNYAPNSGN